MLSQNWTDQQFLKEVAQQGYHVSNDPILAKSSADVHWTPEHRKKGTHGPKQVGDGWWLSIDVTTRIKLLFIQSVASLAGVNVVLDSDSEHGF